jgi:glycosyltransferase involved in cell wall biosynthesis
MNKKILIFVENYHGFMKIYINNIIKSLLKKNYKIIVYSGQKIKIKNIKLIIQKDLDYFLKMHDPRIYEKFLLFAKRKNIYKLYIPRFSFPEYLYSSITSIKFNFEIYLSTFAFELFSKSISRLEILKKLLIKKNIKYLFIHSVLNRHMTIPKKFLISKKIQSKLCFFSEPKYHLNKNFFNIRKAKSNIFKVLYFGNFFYGKGLDLLIESSNGISKNIKILIAGNGKTVNYPLKIKKAKNILIINKYFTDQEMYELFKEVDAVVLPYRKTYKYGTSGVMVNSVQAFKPILVPNIYPFAQVVKKYKFGITFSAENVTDLKNKINNLQKLINMKYFKKSYFLKYLDDLNNWDDFIKKIK